MTEKTKLQIEPEKIAGQAGGAELIEIHPEIKEVLDRHIVELEPIQSGRKELINSMGDAALGMAGVSIGRAVPPLEIESVAISAGKAKVLIGPNGSGKSTYFDALMERDVYPDTGEGSGAIVVGKPVHMRDKFRIGRLDQEEMLDNIGHFTAGEVLNDASSYFKSQFPIDWDNPDYERNMENQVAQARIESLMDQISTLFEMKPFLDTKVSDLSGGERTKLALFMVLLSEADGLLFDEPTNHLDLKSIAKLTALFNRYKKAGIGILSASHVDWFLQDAGNDGVLEIDWSKDKNRRILKESHTSYVNYMKNPAREQNEVIEGEISWTQEDYDYRQGKALTSSPLSFTVPESPLIDVEVPAVYGRELIIMSGNNGSGKTRLMEVMAKNSEENLPRKLKGVHIAYLPQFWPEKIVQGTVGDFFEWVKEDSVPSSGKMAHDPEQPTWENFNLQLDLLNFVGPPRVGESRLERPFNTLSGGEQRILWFIAVSSLKNIDALALDEPTNHMDRQMQNKTYEAIRDFPGAVIVSTHDRNLITALDKDSGKKDGMMRKPINLVLEKDQQRTKVLVSKESPVQYMSRVMHEARQEAKRLKI